jgi:FtsH-binding integral membrane protein
VIPNEGMKPSLHRMPTGGIALLVGASLSLLVARLPWDSLMERVSLPLIGFLIPSILAFVLSGPIASRCHTRSQLYSAGMFTLLGVFIANVANIMYDSYTGGDSHNLFPFEIPVFI